MMKTARKRPGAGMALKTVKNKKQTAKAEPAALGTETKEEQN